MAQTGLARRRLYLLSALGLLCALMALLLSNRVSPVTQRPAAAVQESAETSVRTAPPSSATLTEIADTNNAAIFTAFENWANTVASHPQQQLTPEELARGLDLTKARRVALASLIESDPRQALERALPAPVRGALPQAIQDQLEQQIDGRGDFRVAISSSFDARNAQTFRDATINGKTYKAFVYGTRTSHPCKTNIPLHGIALGDVIALHESPIRVLAKGEIPNPKLPVLNEDLKCPISGIVSREVAVDAGGVIIYLCCSGHIGAIETKIAAGETLHTAWGDLTSSSTSVAMSGPLQSSYTTGVKNVILLRVDFSDAPVPAADTTYNSSLIANLNTFYTQCSYGATSFNLVGSGSDITPIMRMPQPYATYTNGDLYVQLRSDAKAAATALGYNMANYNWDVTCMSSGSGGQWTWGGLAWVGATGAWVRSASPGIPAHEIGHNYGLYHANYWNATNDSIIGPGSNSEYGNQYDTMGSANAGAWQFNSYEKNLLTWLPDTNVTSVATNGTYRILPFDNYTISGTNSYALKIKRDSVRNYWIDLRQLFTSNNWEMNGAEVLWSPWANSNGGSQILDTTPSSPNGENDAAVVVGRTFADTNAQVYVTTIAKNASPPSLDIVVNTGAFPGNHAPTLTLGASTTTVATNTAVTLTATASDADGDALAYYWEYGDGTYSINNVPSESKSWTAAGEYRVRCIVSDMKGGSTAGSIIIKVGSPTTYRVSGTVTIGGAPLAGVRVTDGSIAAFSDSDGTYTLVGETAGNKTISATKFDYTITAGFGNPVNVTGTTTGLNFTATINTHQITGSVKDGSTGIAGVTVTDGTHNTVTDGSGNYTLAGLTNAIYTLVAIKPGYQFTAGAPAEILGADAVQNFTRQLYTVSGQITAVTGAPVVDIGDGVHTTNAYSQGGTTWGYNIQVPAGTWNLKATLAGFTISPSNFSDPLAVFNNLSNQNFSGVSGASYSVSGTITVGSTPFPGVAVSAGAKSSTTDTAGNYAITGLANGSYTVTPAYAGATFAPVNIPATIASANLTGKNFTASLPLTIVTGSPMPYGVINVAYNQTLSAISGTAPYTWSLVSGALPPGLTLNPFGAVVGTPTTAGTFNFSLQVNDSASAVATQAITLVINPALAVTTPSTLAAPISSACSIPMTAIGGFTPYQFWWVGSGSLPTGLTLNSTTGILSGTPTVTGPYNFTVYVEDGSYATASKALTMNITRVGIVTTSLPAGDVSTPYSQALVANNGATPYVWTITTGTLPAGLTMSSAGVISGTPTTVGSSAFTVKVTDKGSVTATQALSITVNPALVITTASLPRFDVGAAYSQTIASTGGTAPLTWMFTGVTPVGTTLDNTGLLSGTPTAPTTGTFTATVTDAAGAVVSRDFIVTADLPLTISTTTLPGATLGAAYSSPIAQIGGNAPFTWTVVSGTLPAGLTLLPNGTVSGTPTALGSSTFKVSCADATPASVSASFTLTVSPPNVAPVVTSGIIPNPYQPGIGDHVIFTFGVNDPNGDPLTYAWDFGDGGTDTAASPIHVFTAIGTYLVTVTATDPGGLSVTSTLSLVVGEVTGTGLPPGTITMTVSKVQGSAKFTGGGHDSVTFTGSIPNVPKGFTPTGKTMTVNFAGATAFFTLDATGKAKSSSGSVALKLKPSIRIKATKQLQFQGGAVGFQIKLMNGTWATAWGIDPNATTTSTKTMLATIQLDGTFYGAVTMVKYSGKAKVGGKFKK